MINGYCLQSFTNNGVQSLFAAKVQYFPEIHQIKGLFSDLVLCQVLFPITLPQAQPIFIPNPSQLVVVTQQVELEKRQTFYPANSKT